MRRAVRELLVLSRLEERRLRDQTDCLANDRIVTMADCTWPQFAE